MLDFIMAMLIFLGGYACRVAAEETEEYDLSEF